MGADWVGVSERLTWTTRSVWCIR
jgi:hypothetical protein